MTVLLLLNGREKGGSIVASRIFLISFIAAMLWSLPPLAAEEVECVDHGTIHFAGQDLGAAQCGDKVIFSDATEMQVPNGYVLIRLGNAFYFYSPTLDKLIDIDVLDRMAIGEDSP